MASDQYEVVVVCTEEGCEAYHDNPEPKRFDAFAEAADYADEWDAPFKSTVIAPGGRQIADWQYTPRGEPIEPDKQP